MTTITWQPDPYLSKVGFFSALPKKQSRILQKSVRLTANLTAQLHVMAHYGPPTAQDFTLYLTYLKLLSYRAEALQKPLLKVIQTPQPITNYQILKLLGHTQAKNNYLALANWRLRLRFTGFTLIQTYEKANLSHDYSPLIDSFAVSSKKNKKVEGFRTSEKHTLLFAPWLQEVIAQTPLTLVREGEFQRYLSLTSPLAQVLVPHLDRWLYASRHDSGFAKNYQDLANLLGITYYPSPALIQRQLSGGLKQLVEAGYLRGWKVERTRYKAYNVVLSGPTQGAHIAVSAVSEPLSTRVPRQVPETTPPRHLTNSHLNDLVTVGIASESARQLLASLPETQPVGRQIAYWCWDFDLRPGHYENKAGFLFQALKQDWPVPDNRAALPQPATPEIVPEATLTGDEEKQRRDERQGELLLAYETYQRCTARAEFAQLPSSQRESYLAATLLKLPAAHKDQDWIPTWQYDVALEEYQASRDWPSFEEWAAQDNPRQNDLVAKFPPLAFLNS